jgi:hypothetical protein
MCPIALAMSRAFPEYRVQVGIFWIFLYNLLGGIVEKEIPMPEAAARFINKFDHGEKVEPMTLEIKDEDISDC